MKRILGAAFAVLAIVTVAVVGGILLARRGMPDDARAQLNAYLTYRYLSASAPSIVRASEATRPSHFTAEMSSGTYSNSVHYRTLHNYRITAQPVRLPSGTEPFKDLGGDYGGYRPLPYPPEDLWCVRLDSAEPGADVVLMALHMDLYNADWVVHELPAAWSADMRRGVLAELGCAVELA